jgi:hypothetical protein
MKRILFFTFLCVFLISLAILEHQKDDYDIIKEKLLEMGYPSKGYVIYNETIRYSDGSFAVLSTPPKKYSISAMDAYKRAEAFLKKREEEYGLGKHDYHLHIKAEDIEEYSENGQYYWAFKLYFGKGQTTGDWMGYVLVDRQSGYCKIQGLFG